MARMFVEAVNARFGAGIEPIRDEEILAVAASLPGGAPRDDAVRLSGLFRPRPDGQAPVKPEPAGQ
jgi:hypothetical protein